MNSVLLPALPRAVISDPATCLRIQYDSVSVSALHTPLGAVINLRPAYLCRTAIDAVQRVDKPAVGWETTWEQAAIRQAPVFPYRYQEAGSDLIIDGWVWAVQAVQARSQVVQSLRKLETATPV